MHEGDTYRDGGSKDFHHPDDGNPIPRYIDSYIFMVPFPVMCMVVADFEVVSTEPHGDMVVPVSLCVEFSCVVEGGSARWIINVRQPDHQFRLPGRCLHMEVTLY